MYRKHVCRFCITLIVLAGAIPGLALTPLGTAFTYQGQLKELSEPLTDTADFQFALWDSLAGGSQIGSTQTVPGVGVVDGLFTVSLDFGAAAFVGQARWLEIAVRVPAGAGAYIPLSPRQPLTATPYALYALAAPATTNADTVDGFHAAAAPAANTLLTLNGAAKFPNTALYTGTGNGLDADLLDGQHGSYFQNAGNINAGVLADARLSNNVALLNNAQTFSGAKTFGTAPVFSAAGAPFSVTGTTVVTNLNVDYLDGQHGSFYRNASNLNAGEILETLLPDNVALLDQEQTFEVSQYFAARIGIGTTNPTVPLDVRSGDIWLDSSMGRLRIGFPAGDGWYWSTSGGGATLLLREDPIDGGATTRVTFAEGGNVGIGTTAPTALLHVTGENAANPIIRGVNTALGDLPGVYGEHATSDYSGIGVQGLGGWRGVEGRVLPTGSSTYTGVYGYVNGGTGSNRGVHGYASGSGSANYGVYGYAYGAATNYGVYGYAAGGSTDWAGYFSGDVRVTANMITANAGVGTTAPEVKLHVAGGTDASVAGGGYVVIGATASTNMVMDNNEIMARNNGATSTLYLNAEGGDVQVPVLVISGGSDLAERFDVTDDIQPGMVVAIDPQNPGKLCLAKGAYNRRVAGVISGANDLGAGMILADLPGAKNSQPVALTGRVWTYCDATARAVEPGDLLTTAERPGYAMPVEEYGRAQGAIIGKAMTSLAKGETGLVLVLVNLQ